MVPLLSVPNLLLVHINQGLLVKDTPLQAMFDDGRVDGTCCKTIHLSDIFRLAVLFRSVESLTSLSLSCKQL